MKLKYLILSLIFVIPIYSQQFTLGISGGADLLNSNLTNKTNYLNSYWHKGIFISLNGEYFISKRASLNSIIEYSYYRFDHYSFDVIHIPEIGLVSAKGESSNAIRIFENIRYYTYLNDAFKYFFTTGIGYISENIGTITAKFSDLNSGESISKIKYEGHHIFVHYLGIGIRFKFAQKLAFDITGSYYSDYINIFNIESKISLIYLFK